MGTTWGGTRVWTWLAGLIWLALSIAGAAPAMTAILPVTVCNDNGAQLRGLIINTGAGDTVTLPLGCIITLTGAGGPITLTKTLPLIGAGAGQTVLDGGNVTGVLFVNNATAVATTVGITLQHGRDLPAKGRERSLAPIVAR